MTVLPPSPPWLSDEPELLKLLGAVLDRFDQQSGETRRQRLGAEKALPALLRLDTEADQLWRFVNVLKQRGLLEIKPGIRGPYDAEYAVATGDRHQNLGW